VDETGRVLKRRRFELTPPGLAQFAREHLGPDDRLALEATTNTWAVARIVKPHVAEVAVGNPLKIKHIAEAHVKTDKIDAEVLAQLLRCNYFPRVWQPDEATLALRELTGRRTALVAQRTAVRNRIHATLAMRLVEYGRRELFTKAGLAWLAEMPLDNEARLLVDLELALHAALEAQIAALEAELARRGHDEPRVKLLMTLPAFDVAVAEAVLAALGDVSRFPDGDHAASYLGLVPKTRASAHRTCHGSITKAGNSQARWMLVQAAHTVARHPGPLGHFFRKLCKKKNYNVAVVAVARKLAVIAWQMLTRNEPYRYAVPKSTEQKLARLRVKATGRRKRSGVAKGQRAAARLPGGSRRIKPLAEVYAAEGLPAPQPLSAGEQRSVAQSGSAAFVAGLAHEQFVPRKKVKTAAAAAATAARSTAAASDKSAPGDTASSGRASSGRASSTRTSAARARTARRR
jgi:transposase